MQHWIILIKSSCLYPYKPHYNPITTLSPHPNPLLSSSNTPTQIYLHSPPTFYPHPPFTPAPLHSWGQKELPIYFDYLLEVSWPILSKVQYYSTSAYNASIYYAGIGSVYLTEYSRGFSVYVGTGLFLLFIQGCLA